MIRTDWNVNEDRNKGDLFGGVGYYRIELPARYLRKLGHGVDVIGKHFQEKFGTNAIDAWERVFSHYDVVWSKSIDSGETLASMAFMAKRYKKPLVIDMDDNHLELMPDNPVYEKFLPGTKKRAIYGAMIHEATMLSVSTYPLKQSFTTLLKDVYDKDANIFVLPNCCDPEEWKPRPKRNDGEVVIGWAGSITHNEDLKSVMPALNRILKEHKHVRLRFLGGVEAKHAGHIFQGIEDLGRVEVGGGTPGWEGYPELLCNTQWDIGIAPLLDTPFNRCKSHIKWMEYALAGIPAVVSKVYPYYKDVLTTKTVQDGKTGMVAETEEEWFVALDTLIRNESLRLDIAKRARAYIQKEWSMEKNVQKWHTVIEQVTNNYDAF